MIPRTLVLAATALLGAGCVPPHLVIAHDRPPEVNLAPATTLSVSVAAAETGFGSNLLDLVEIVGSAHDRFDPKLPVDALRDAINAQLNQDDRFHPASAGHAPDATVQVVITMWSQSAPEPDEGQAPYLSGTLVAQVSVARPGASPVTRKITETTDLPLDADDVSDAVEKALVESCARQVAWEVTSLFTPRPHENWVELDDSADAVKPAVELMRSARWDEASRALWAVLAHDPYLAAAHYDLGVIAEARGDLAQAESSYHRALELEPTSFHQDAFNRIRAVEADQRAIQGPAQPAPPAAGSPPPQGPVSAR